MTSRYYAPVSFSKPGGFTVHSNVLQGFHSIEIPGKVEKLEKTIFQARKWYGINKMFWKSCVYISFWHHTKYTPCITN